MLQVACPALSISPDTFLAAATAAASAAGLTLASSTFDPYSTAGEFFLAAFIFEDVGVTAYHGAIANLQVSLPEFPLHAKEECAEYSFFTEVGDQSC